MREEGPASRRAREARREISPGGEHGRGLLPASRLGVKLESDWASRRPEFTPRIRLVPEHPSTRYREAPQAKGSTRFAIDQ